MGRAPCCEKDTVKRGPWTPEEDAKLLACIAQHGTGSWRTLPKKAGLQRCGKSCRLRWTNYLRPDLKHGRFTDHEEQLIVKLHAALGSRWSLIAAQLPGRTDNDVKNYWNTRLKKKLCEMGIDPITHKPISQLLADLAGSIAIPKGGQIAEAALGCFKDDMLNVLMRKRPDWQLEGGVGTSSLAAAPSGSLYRPRQTWQTGSIHEPMQDAQRMKHSVPSTKLGTTDEPELPPDVLLMRGTFGAFPTAEGGPCFFDTKSDFGHYEASPLGLHVGITPSEQTQQVYGGVFPQHTGMVGKEYPGQARKETEAAAWSSPSGSSCSSTTLADVSVLEGVLSSDVPLWDFSELSSIIY